MYELLGLLVDTPLAIPGSVRDDGSPDIAVSVGESVVVSFDDPDGELLADRRGPTGERWYCLGRSDGAFVLRLPGLCDVRFSTDLATAEFAPVEGVSDEHLSIILGGTAISALLLLRGAIVLHGSAVEQGGRAIGFLGDSGQGKSTLAAGCCAAGWQLVTDDALRIDLDGPATCPPGAREIRLRYAPISDPVWPARRTIDDRLAVAPPAAARPSALAALVIPFPDRDATRVSARRLESAPAIHRLLYYLRIAGWRDPGVLRAVFGQAATIAADVPVWEVAVPWGDRLVPTTIDELTSAVMGG